MSVTRRSPMITDRQARLAAGSVSGRVSAPAPEDGRRVASGPAAPVGTRPADARSARGRIAAPTADPALETTAARILVRRGPGRTVHPGRSPRSPRDPGRIGRPPSRPVARPRTIDRLGSGKTTAPRGPGGIARSRRATPGPNPGTSRDRIPATRHAPHPRPIAPRSLPGSSRTRLPPPRRARLARPRHGRAVPRTVVAPAVPGGPAAPGRDRAVRTPGTGRTTRAARTPSRILRSRSPATRNSSPGAAPSRRHSSPAARRSACSWSRSDASRSRSSCSTR